MTTLRLTMADDFVYIVTIQDEDGVAYNLVDCTLWWTAKRRKSDDDSAAIAKLYWISGGASDGITVVTPANGQATIRLTPTQTDDFTAYPHVWDLQLKDASGVIRTVDSGVLYVSRSVTVRTTTP